MGRRLTTGDDMPLIKNAKPGSKGFKQNIETEIKMGNKPPKQAVAIAYNEYDKSKKKPKKSKT
jgi:hypothetical protein